MNYLFLEFRFHLTPSEWLGFESIQQLIDICFLYLFVTYLFHADTLTAVLIATILYFAV